MEKKKPKFLRTGSKRFKRLGKGRKKLQRWRKPNGRDNKIREKKKGRSVKVMVGYRTKKSDRGKIKGKEVIIVKNLKDIEKIKDHLVIIAKIGKKKRLEIEKKLKEKNIQILNKKQEKNEPKK